MATDSHVGIIDHIGAGNTTATQHGSPQSAITHSSTSPSWDKLRNEEEQRDFMLKKCELHPKCVQSAETNGRAVLEEGIHRLYASTASESIVEAFRDLIPTSEVLRLVCVALQEVISTGPTISALEKTGRALEMFRHQVSSENIRNQEELFMAGSWICTLHVSSLPRV
jgi:hypothetical protein